MNRGVGAGKGKAGRGELFISVKPDLEIGMNLGISNSKIPSRRE